MDTVLPVTEHVNPPSTLIKRTLNPVGISYPLYSGFSGIEYTATILHCLHGTRQRRTCKFALSSPSLNQLAQGAFLASLPSTLVPRVAMAIAIAHDTLDFHKGL